MTERRMAMPCVTLPAPWRRALQRAARARHACQQGAALSLSDTERSQTAVSRLRCTPFETLLKAWYRGQNARCPAGCRNKSIAASVWPLLFVVEIQGRSARHLMCMLLASITEQDPLVKLLSQ